jgi:hypothetical protein
MRARSPGVTSAARASAISRVIVSCTSNRFSAVRSGRYVSAQSVALVRPSNSRAVIRSCSPACATAPVTSHRTPRSSATAGRAVSASSTAGPTLTARSDTFASWVTIDSCIPSVKTRVFSSPRWANGSTAIEYVLSFSVLPSRVDKSVARASADAYRWSGSFCKHVDTIDARARGTSDRRACIGTGSSCRIASSTSNGRGPENGRSPVSIS